MNLSGKYLLKPRLAAEPIRHQRFEQFVEFWTVIWMHNVHKLVGDHVVDARDRGAYQIRIQQNSASAIVAAPPSRH